MADPFQDVDAAGDDFIATFADSMDARQADPTMERIVAGYLDRMDFAAGSLTVEVGCGAGAVTRRIAARALPERVVGFEPSVGFVKEARDRGGDLANVTFEVADGTQLPLGEGVVDNLILHTVLTHVADPVPILKEAHRVVRPGGCLIVCDADFSKASLGSGPSDPLDTCAGTFVREFVTDPYIVAKLRPLVSGAGFDVESMDIQSRTIRDNDQMLPWVVETGKLLMARDIIGAELHEGLVAEYRRRAASGTLYGYQVFATVVGRRR